MGNKHTVCLLTRDQIIDYVESTHFTSEEIRALWFHFKEISSSVTDDDIIDKAEFQKAMLFRDSSLLEQIFRVFDTDHDGSISFSEFISCLSTFSSKGTPEEKLRLSFQIYDADGDNFIDKGELRGLVTSTMREHDVVFSSDSIARIVDETFAEIRPANPSDGISFEEYRAMVRERPQALSILTLNISSIIAEYAEAHGVSFGASPRGDSSGLSPTSSGSKASFSSSSASSRPRGVRKSSRAEAKGL
mmetsp:Transcript_26345/g.49424  ORF Transcript_26345/g.49424 Transcript_26345/m.49424 type:complete len:247 (-) Transcript_26345:169-909(-)